MNVNPFGILTLTVPLSVIAVIAGPPAAEDAIVIDVDVTLDLPKSITSFSLSKVDINQMIETCTEKGQEFADKIFENFDIVETKERCFAYTNSNLEKRRNKAGDGLMGLVDILNALYVLKNDVI